MKVVFDTMVFVQNASKPDRTHATAKAVQDGRATLFLSMQLVAEVRDVLSRPKVRARFPALTDRVVDAFIANVLARGVMIDPVPRAFTWPHHSDDDHVFNLAIAASAERMLTVERRILEMKQKFPEDAQRLQTLAPELIIEHPKDFAAELRADQPQPPDAANENGVR